MRARKLFDIGYSDLMFGAAQCLYGARVSSDRQENLVSQQLMICYSARSGFDLLLQALSLPEGSEVLMTAATIPDMIEIVRRHGLVPKPIDLDQQSFRICPDSFNRALTSKTRLVVVAHLFGARTDIEFLNRHPRREQFEVVEDCAQLFVGEFQKQPTQSEYQLFSFGPIKSATALGGGLICCRDPLMLEQIQKISSAYPVQSRWSYLKRIAKYFCLKLLTTRILYSVLFRTLKDPDKRLGSLARNFSDQDLLTSIRLQPCRALIAMIKRRLGNYSTHRIDVRHNLGVEFQSRINSDAASLGQKCEQHSFWVFPVLSNNGEKLVKRLRHAGFDATQRHSMTVLDTTKDSCPENLTNAFQRIVFVPFGPELRPKEIGKMADIIENSC